jgi:outer membrane lipoprotein carrier protein
MLIAVLAALLPLVAIPVSQGGALPPDELARRIQAKYEQVRDFTADFEHTYEGGVLRQKVTERGKLQIKKPGKMRWTYTAPEKKEFVSDGRKLYSYVPEDRQVIVSDVPRMDQAGSPILFLAGKGSVVRDFKASDAQVSGVGAGEQALKLVPVAPQEEYDWIVLVVDRANLQLRRLITADAQGGTSSFTFRNLKENVGLPDKAFSFTIPRGVDVITDGKRSR